MKTETRKFIGAELRAAGEDKYLLTGRAVRYRALSEMNIPVQGCRERVMPGAFSASLQRGDTVYARLNHDENYTLAKTGAGLTLQDSADGLRFSIQLNPAVQFHRDVYELAKGPNPIVDCCSFGFMDAEDSFVIESGQPIRQITSARLVDVSVLSTFPAYSNGATAVQARSASVAYKFATLDGVEALRTKLAAMDSDFEARRKCHEIGLQVLRDLSLAAPVAAENDGDEDEDDRAIQDFLSSRFGLDSTGRVPRYVLSNVEVSSEGSKHAVCYDMDAAPASNGSRVRIRIMARPDGSFDCGQPQPMAY